MESSLTGFFPDAYRSGGASCRSRDQYLTPFTAECSSTVCMRRPCSVGPFASFRSGLLLILRGQLCTSLMRTRVSNSLGYRSRGETSGSHDNCERRFGGTAKLFSKASCCISISSTRRVRFLYSSARAGYDLSFMRVILGGTAGSPPVPIISPL